MIKIVTIKSILSLYKGNEKALNIELLEFEETGFNCVVKKDLYKINEKLQYIEPDTILPQIELFNDFIQPNNDYSKSYLGKIEGVPRRVRAKKFTFSTTLNGDNVYSQGILLPLTTDLTNVVFEKYEEPTEYKLIVGATKPFPENWYKTDETNIMNKIGKITFPITLVGTEKIDGSSISFGWENNEYVICSRNLKKPITYNKCIGYKKPSFLNKVYNFIFNKNKDLRIFEEVLNDDVFVNNAVIYKETLFDAKINENKEYVFRGELHGNNFKGSGNKLNPYKGVPVQIKTFGLDVNNKKASYEVWQETSKRYSIPVVDTLFIKEFNSFDEIIDTCNNIFKGKTMEGVVVRTLDSTFSAKVMSLEYDSKK